jgi:hypothetical protein
MPRLSSLIYLYFIVLACAPVVCLFDYYSVDQGFFKIYGSTLLLLGILLMLTKGFQGSRISALFVMAIIVYLYHITWDIVLDQGTYARKGFVFDFFTNPFLHIAFLIYVVDNYEVPESLIKTILKIIKYTVFLGFAVTVVQLLVNPFFLTPKGQIEEMIREGVATNSFELRRKSIFAFSNGIDVSLSLISILAIYVSYYAITERKISYLVILFGVVIAFANNSRYLQVAAFFPMMPLLALGKSKVRTFMIILLSVPLTLLVAVQVLELAGVDVQAYIEQRVLARSADTRLLAIEIFNRYFWDRPLFGTGVHMTKQIEVAIAGRSSQIHVGYLAHLVSYGIVGSVLEFGLWFAILKRFYETARRSAFWGSFIGMGMFLWANVTLVYYVLFVYGLMIAFLFDKYYADKAKIIIQDENNLSSINQEEVQTHS